MSMNDTSGASAELPKYQCHKQVWALKIARIVFHESAQGEPPAATIVPENDRYAPFDVEAKYVAKHNPQAGGYYVVYDDGYKSWSPAEAFESGYTLI
jgi:hypothetical protein